MSTTSAKIENLLSRANAGNKEAQYKLGLKYYYGHGVGQDFVAAFGQFERAAQQGLQVAWYAIGVLSERGIGEIPDDSGEYWTREKFAFWSIHNAAEAGCPEAQYEIGRRLLSGGYLPPDYSNNLTSEQREKKAEQWLQKAAAQGQAGEIRKLARQYEFYATVYGIYYDEMAIKLYGIAASHGDKKALENLAIRCENGRGVDKDSDLADRLWMIADGAILHGLPKYFVNALGGDAEAQYDLGTHYYDGRSDLELQIARNWLSKSAKQGHQATIDYCRNNEDFRQCLEGAASVPTIPSFFEENSLPLPEEPNALANPMIFSQQTQHIQSSGVAGRSRLSIRNS